MLECLIVVQREPYLFAVPPGRGSSARIATITLTMRAKQSFEAYHGTDLPY